VTARYHLLVSDELMDSSPGWAACGLTPVEQEPTDPERHPGMHWWLFEDRDAAAELQGKRVELEIGRADSGDGSVWSNPVILDRSVISW
jgi:hypothetical protein